MKLFYSSEARGILREQLGQQHYSYRFVEQKFVALFERLGLAPQLLPLPEAVKHRLAWQALAGGPPDEAVHVAFRSSENFRPVVGMPNVCHFAWEFPVLADARLPHQSIRQNQLHMLGLADEVWVPCRYTLEVLRAHGLANTHLVPTPVGSGTEPCPRLPFAEAVARLAEVFILPLELSTGLHAREMAEVSGAALDLLGQHKAIRERRPDSRIFLLICNPGDLRKNLLNCIDGFLLGAGPDDLLIVKLLVPNKGDFMARALADHLAPLYHGRSCISAPQVACVTEYLSNEMMSALYSIADFYLSAPHCEGYNLPLLEAMAHGTVPVSNRNTAMADYIDEDNAVVIADAAYPGLIRGMAGDVAGRPYAVAVSSRFDIGRAVRTARRLDPGRRAAMAEAARETVRRGHSEAAVVPLVLARLQALTGRVPARVEATVS